MLEAASPGASVARVRSAGEWAPLHGGASKLLRGRGHATRADVCVGNAEDIAEEEWAIKLSSFPVCGSVVIFLDSSRRLLVRRRLRGGSDVS